jgi:single-stranded-DNA-specific exonuclease
MEKWIEIRKGGNFMEMAKKYGIDPLIARIIRNRDITDEKEITEYLYGGKEALHNPVRDCSIHIAAAPADSI